MSTYDDEVKVWEVTDPKTKDKKTYEQRELSIDGEAQLFQLAYRAAERLQATDFPWARLRDLFKGANADIDWAVAAELLGKAVPLLPDVAAEAVAIMWGQFPFDEDGRRVTGFDEEKHVIRRWLTISKMVDVFQTFADMNDYRRLIAPFETLMAEGARRGLGPQSIPSQPASGS